MLTISAGWNEAFGSGRTCSYTQQQLCISDLGGPRCSIVNTFSHMAYILNLKRSMVVFCLESLTANAYSQLKNDFAIV